MALKVCGEPGCPELTDHPTGKCGGCRRAADAARGRRQERGYGRKHERLRDHYQRRMDRGEAFICWRCEEKGKPHEVDPTRWDLGHDDHDRSIYRGPECRGGNRAVASH